MLRYTDLEFFRNRNWQEYLILFYKRQMNKFSVKNALLANIMFFCFPLLKYYDNYIHTCNEFESFSTSFFHSYPFSLLLNHFFPTKSLPLSCLLFLCDPLSLIIVVCRCRSVKLFTGTLVAYRLLQP